MPRVLVVDDEQSIREMLEIYLQREGYEVSCAADGKTALDLCRQTAFDVVVADIKMPKIDGLAVLEHVRKDPQLRRMPVIILTTSKREEDQLKSYDLGANAFVVKPVGFENFSHAVGTINLFWQLVELPETKEKET